MLFWLATVALAAPGSLGTQGSLHTLDNGLRVVIENQSRTDTVALRIYYGVGAVDEQPGTFGCAHLFEHLMFEGSKNVPTNAFDEWLTSAGGDNNAYTSNDETVYHMTFPSGALDLALFLESDRLAFLDAGLTPENVANQQMVVLQERAQGYEEPHGRDWDALGYLTYLPTDAYHHPVIGTVADINAFAPEKVRAFWEAHYRPRNAILVVSGNVDEAKALAAVKSWFSDVPDKGTPERKLAAPTSYAAGNGYIEDDVEDLTLMMSWPAAAQGSADEPATDLLSFILSGGRGTRLDDALYYQKALTLSVGAGYSANLLDGQFIVQATTTKLSLPALEKKILAGIDGVIAQPPTQAELDRARTALRSSWLDALEHPQGRTGLLLECVRRSGQPNCLDAEWARYESVKTDDLVRVARQIFDHSRRARLSVVPRGSAKKALPGATVVEMP